MKIQKKLAERKGQISCSRKEEDDDKNDDEDEDDEVYRGKNEDDNETRTDSCIGGWKT